MSDAHVARPRLALAAICVGFFLVLLDTTILNVALPQIGRDLNASTSGLQWVVNAYTIAFAALLLSGGALSDRLGTLRIYVLGMAGFGVASLLCAAAPALGLLIAGRALQGLAAAAMVPSSLSLIAHTFPEPRERARAVGIWIGSSGLAAALGPILGGILVEYVDWRAVFVINLPVVIAGILVARRHVPAVPKGPGRALDLPGQALAIVFLTSLTAALIETGDHGWSSPWVWGTLAVAAMSLVALLAVERRHRDPVVPIALFRNPRFAAGNTIGALVNLGYYGQLFVLSLYFQDVLGYSPLRAGLAFLPLFASTFFISWAAGRMTARWGPARPMAIGLLVGLIGLAVPAARRRVDLVLGAGAGPAAGQHGRPDPGPPLGRGHRRRAARAVRRRLGCAQRPAPDGRGPRRGDPRLADRRQRLRGRHAVGAADLGERLHAVAGADPAVHAQPAAGPGSGRRGAGPHLDRARARRLVACR